MTEYKKGKVTLELFSVVKTLLDSGNTNAEVARFLKMSVNTVCNIKKAETYEEYKAIAYAQCKAYKAKTAESTTHDAPQQQPAPQEVIKEVRQSVTIQATHYMMQELQKTNELLALISRKLGYIVDDLCGTKNAEKEG